MVYSKRNQSAEQSPHYIGRPPKFMNIIFQAESIWIMGDNSHNQKPEHIFFKAGCMIIAFGYKIAHYGSGKLAGHTQELISRIFMRHKHYHAMVKNHSNNRNQLKLIGGKGLSSAVRLCPGAFKLSLPYAISLPYSNTTGPLEAHTSSQTSGSASNNITAEQFSPSSSLVAYTTPISPSSGSAIAEVPHSS